MGGLGNRGNIKMMAVDERYLGEIKYWPLQGLYAQQRRPQARGRSRVDEHGGETRRSTFQGVPRRDHGMNSKQRRKEER